VYPLDCCVVFLLMLISFMSARKSCQHQRQTKRAI
jgi:hypothetical protein